MFIKYFGIKNFKVFSEFTEFEFAPITVLTGKNNSGKSSLIKALQVSSDSSITKLKLNDETGDLANTLSWGAPDKKKMSFSYNLPPDFGNCCVKLDYENGELCDLKLFNKENHSEILSFENFSEEKIFFNLEEDINHYDKCETYQKFDVKWDFTYFVEKYKTNLTSEDIGKIKSNKYLDSFSGKGALDSANRLNNPFRAFAENEELYNSFWSNFSKKDKVSFNYLNSSNEVFEVEKNLISTIKNAENEILTGESSFKTLIRTYDINEYQETKEHYGENLYLYLINSFIKQLLLNVNKSVEKIANVKLDMSEKKPLTEFFSKLDKIQKVNSLERISTVRSTSKRVFLKNNRENELEKLAFEITDISNKEQKKEIISFVNSAFELLEINTKFILPTTYEQVATSIKLEYKNGKELNIVDFGFGYAQLISILLKIVVTAKYSYYDEFLTDRNSQPTYKATCMVLEEPEANLHPNLQSKLAEVIVKASTKYNMQFIIETHSEYFIRKLQYLTAKKEINTSDTVIYYFNNPLELKKGEKQINKITINSNGMLSDSFGSGFFDEATNMKIELLRINNIQKN